MAGLYLDSRGYFECGLDFLCNTYPGSNVSICDCLPSPINSHPLSFVTIGIGETGRSCVAGFVLVGFSSSLRHHDDGSSVGFSCPHSTWDCHT